MEEYISEERLSDDEHFRLVSDFCCGTNESLDNFLKSEAFEYNRDGQGNTYLLRLKETEEIVGYYTLKSNAIQAYNEEQERIEALPSIEIARLAVQYKFQKNGFGRFIFTYYIIPKINKVKDIIGLNTVMVFVDDDYNEEVPNEEDRVKYFYTKLGFKLAEDEVQRFIIDDYNEGCKLMYMSTEGFNNIENEIKS